ncbi:MAG: clathrin heavy chain, partial [Amphiamblys sp. WSBS2006]
MELPVTVKEIESLERRDVQFVGFQTVTMNSDKYVCVRQSEDGAEQVLVLDLESGAEILRKPIRADSAVMHPQEELIALKAGRALQVFDIAQKARVKACQISDDISFWRWISPDALGIVTGSAVYHWDVRRQAVPERVFARHRGLDGTQIINYRTSKDMQWCAVLGVSAEHGRISGSIQLHSREKDVSQF